MPRGIVALSSHQLFSTYRGPVILNMADDDAAKAAADKANTDKAASDAKAKEEAEAKAKKEDTEGRISQLANENKELRKAAKEREEADKKAEEERLAKKGEHEKLAQQYAGERDAERKKSSELESKLKVYENHAKEQIKQGLESITDAEKKKSAEAMLDGLSTEEQMRRLPDIMKLVGSTAATFGTKTVATNVQNAPINQKKAQFTALMDKEKKGEKLTPQERVQKNELMVELGEIWNKEQEEARKKAAI
jgi:hypothetical protein